MYQFWLIQVATKEIRVSILTSPYQREIHISILKNPSNKSEKLCNNFDKSNLNKIQQEQGLTKWQDKAMIGLGPIEVALLLR